MMLRDVAIIGGGLAGATAAARLAQQGADVILFEKEAAPHRKVCGEFISYEAQHYLQKLGIDLADHGAEPIDSLRLTSLNQTLKVPLGFQALSLSRKTLDEKVLIRAKELGAEIHYGTPISALAQQGQTWHIALSDGETVAAKTIFIATGKHDLRGWSHREKDASDYIGFKMYFEMGAAQRAELARHVDIMLYPGGYAGLELVENGKANLCVIITKAQFAACGKNWEALLQYLMQAIPVLKCKLAGAVAVWDKPLAISNIPYGFIYRASTQDNDNLFRIGDQMAVIPSLCGDGMAIAMYTAFLAADSYAKTTAVAYHRNARQQLLWQIRNASFAARLLASPLTQPLMLRLCRFLPKFIPAIIRHTRVQLI